MIRSKTNMIIIRTIGNVFLTVSVFFVLLVVFFYFFLSMMIRFHLN